MLVNRRWGRLSTRRPALGSVAAALLVIPLLLAFALPVSGAAAKKLTDASVSPRSGTTSTKIAFEVTYTMPMKPVGVWVVVGGKKHAMSRLGDGEWSGKDRFRWAGELPAGTHDAQAHPEADAQADANAGAADGARAGLTGPVWL